MVANLKLAAERGISEKDVDLINVIHEQLEDMIENAQPDDDRSRQLGIVRVLEFSLQKLWGFTQDSRYHTWYLRLQKRYMELDYVGVTYRCRATLQEVTVTPEALGSGKLLGVGQGFIDFGSVVRLVGPIERVK
jgi:hypothetical protein